MLKEYFVGYIIIKILISYVNSKKEEDKHKKSIVVGAKWGQYNLKTHILLKKHMFKISQTFKNNI